MADPARKDATAPNPVHTRIAMAALGGTTPMCSYDMMQSDHVGAFRREGKARDKISGDQCAKTHRFLDTDELWYTAAAAASMQHLIPQE